MLIILTVNDRGYSKFGIAWLRLYQTIQNIPAGELEKPLKPVLGMSRCYRLVFCMPLL
jgi:hypothetical protein